MPETSVCMKKGLCPSAFAQTATDLKIFVVYKKFNNAR
jgi:hypothetical protein